MSVGDAVIDDFSHQYIVVAIVNDENSLKKIPVDSSKKDVSKKK
jgi:hypothetical protein